MSLLSFILQKYKKNPLMLLFMIILPLICQLKLDYRCCERKQISRACFYIHMLLCFVLF